MRVRECFSAMRLEALLEVMAVPQSLQWQRGRYARAANLAACARVVYTGFACCMMTLISLQICVNACRGIFGHKMVFRW